VLDLTLRRGLPVRNHVSVGSGIFAVRRIMAESSELTLI
jgi:hypothetical protein